MINIESIYLALSSKYFHIRIDLPEAECSQRAASTPLSRAFDRTSTAEPTAIASTEHTAIANNSSRRDGSLDQLYVLSPPPQIKLGHGPLMGGAQLN